MSRARSTCPDLGGGTNFMSPSYDPTLRLFFVTARETCATYFAFDQEFKVGVQYMAGGTVRPRDQRNWGALRAIDPVTAERKWEFRYPTMSSSGVLSTASGLVFAGDGDGNLLALRFADREEAVALPARRRRCARRRARPTCSMAGSICWCRRGRR